MGLEVEVGRYYLQGSILSRYFPMQTGSPTLPNREICTVCQLRVHTRV